MGKTVLHLEDEHKLVPLLRLSLTDLQISDFHVHLVALFVIVCELKMDCILSAQM